MKTDRNTSVYKMASVKIADKTFYLAIPNHDHDDKVLLVVGKARREYRYNVKLPQNYLELWWNLVDALENCPAHSMITLEGDEYSKIAHQRLSANIINKSIIRNHPQTYQS